VAFHSGPDCRVELPFFLDLSDVAYNRAMRSTPVENHSDANDNSSIASPEHEERNFLTLAAYMIAMRVGWIFKTESIVIPAFLDTISGAGWVRGFLPMFNRFGQSIPPILFARRLKVMPRKKWALAAFSLAMGLVFLALSAMWSWFGGAAVGWLPAAFLALYALFFVCTGLGQLANGTLQGKLVRTRRRGSLLMVSTTVGAALAMSAAWLLLGDWLALDPPGFQYVFAFTGALFLVSAVLASRLSERADHHTEAPVALREIFKSAGRILRDDRRFRRLALVGVLFSSVLLLFPHYQAMARERMGMGLDHLMLWVVVQNAGTGLFSTIAGPLADRRGNRLVLRLVTFGSAATPVLAVVLSASPTNGRLWFWLVFVSIGLTPIMFKVMTNYTLEISAKEDHPRYLSTLSLCIAAPFCFSPLVGWLIDATSFELVMLVGATLILLGGLLTFWLDEPRHEHHPEIVELTIDNVDVGIED
jgi:predicted MFS family arabinose efflux permease